MHWGSETCHGRPPSLRRLMFAEEDLPSAIRAVADRGDHNVIFVPRTSYRYYECRPLLHFIPKATLKRHGLPLMYRGSRVVVRRACTPVAFRISSDSRHRHRSKSVGTGRGRHAAVVRGTLRPQATRFAAPYSACRRTSAMRNCSPSTPPRRSRRSPSPTTTSRHAGPVPPLLLAAGNQLRPDDLDQLGSDPGRSGRLLKRQQDGGLDFVRLIPLERACFTGVRPADSRKPDHRSQLSAVAPLGCPCVARTDSRASHPGQSRYPATR